MTTQIGTLRRKDIRRRFDRAAGHFEDADFLHRACCTGLLERLAPVRIEPARILDVGAATGRGSRELAKTFRKSRVISFDLSAGMLRAARSRKPFLSKLTELQGDAMQLPLQSGSIDLVFANLFLPWITDLPACLGEFSRVLKKGGVFAFATLGPDSLQDLQIAWSADGQYEHVNHFPDMHDVGDAMVRAGLADPVLDVDQVTVSYRDVAALYRDLSASGARNCLHNRRPTLTGRGRFEEMERLLKSRMIGQQLSLKFELVFGHAWGAGPRLGDGEFRVDPATITRRTRV